MADRMMPKVYIETTIVSYLTAWPSRDVLRLSHEIATREWWELRRASFSLYVSAFVMEEASAGDPIAAKERLETLMGIPLLPTTPEVKNLANRLSVAMSLPRRAFVDAAHVATAPVYGVEFLLTWNCTHLANGMLAGKIEETCAASGYKSPRIVTPIMLMGVP